MLASTAGPPRKPVLAATSSNPPSSGGARPTAGRLVRSGSASLCSPEWPRKVTAFSVWPSTGATCHKRIEQDDAACP